MALTSSTAARVVEDLVVAVRVHGTVAQWTVVPGWSQGANYLPGIWTHWSDGD